MIMMIKSKIKREFKNISILHLMHYHFPLAAKVSIIHRISGIILFILMPFIAYLFKQSLYSAFLFTEIKQISSPILIKILILLIIGAYIFHVCAGIRFLFFDICETSNTKKNSKYSALIILIVVPCIMVLITLKFFGIIIK